MKTYNKDCKEMSLVGYIGENGGFYCDACIDKHGHRCNVYLVNILPYNQHCNDCGRLVVDGQTSYWPDLYDKPK